MRLSEKLYWHCEYCGGHEPAQPEYEHGDTEPCVCGDGVAVVMTTKEAAKLEQEVALGIRKPKSAYTTDRAALAVKEQK